MQQELGTNYSKQARERMDNYMRQQIRLTFEDMVEDPNVQIEKLTSIYNELWPTDKPEYNNVGVNKFRKDVHATPFELEDFWRCFELTRKYSEYHYKRLRKRIMDE